MQTITPRTGGQGAETGALANALRRAGARDAFTGEPPTEGLILALSGGIGFHLASVGKGNETRPLLEGSAQGLSARAARVEHAATLLRTPIRIHHAPNDFAAENVLAEETANARAVLTWVDQASLPHHRLPRGYDGAIPRLVGVLEFDEAAEEFSLDDGAAVPVPVDALRLRSARAQAPGAANRCASFDAALGPADVAAASLGALREAMLAHRDAPIANRGTLGMRTLANRLRRGAKRGSFIGTFPRGERLLFALSGLYRFVANTALGPALGRALWADALAEVAARAGLSVLGEEGEAWLDIVKRWDNFAEATLPAEVRRLAEVRLLLETQHLRYERDGLDAINLVVSTQARLTAIGAECETDFPLTEAEISDHLDDLAGRLDDICGLEHAAADRVVAITS